MTHSSRLPTASTSINRRQCLTQTMTAATAATIAASLSSSVHAAGSDVIKVGIVGCGGRGSGAVGHALSTGPNVRLTAMADAYQDRLDISYSSLMRSKARQSRLHAGEGFGSAIDVPPERRFVGLDAYRQLIDTDVDVVILSGPPGFRPAHFQYAIDRGKHVFMEKPVAADPSGVRQIIASSEIAKQKKLKVGVGLQRHHDSNYTEVMRRIHDGEIGRIKAMRCFWNTSAPAKTPVPKGNMSELEYQVRNWYWFDWLSGDHICEQHIHNLDVCNWAMQNHPISAEGMGGRQVRTGKEYGNIFDHHAVLYTYADGTTMHSYCRQIPGCDKFVGEFIEGTTARAETGTTRCTIARLDRSGNETIAWTSQTRGKEKSKRINPYQAEFDALMTAIKDDTPHNEAEQGAMSTMTAVLGRLATYSGKKVSWDDAFASEKTSFSDPLTWDESAPVAPLEDGTYAIPVPGKTTVI